MEILELKRKLSDMINKYDGFNSRVVSAKEVGESKQNRLIENRQTEPWWERMNETKCKRLV